jgi:hypothetical protein
VNWYWVITNDAAVADPFVSDSDDLRGYEDWAFRQCQRIDDWSDSAWLKAARPENDGQPDDSLQSHLPLLIFSRRLRSALEDQGIEGIQYLPINVIRPNGQRIDGFAIANILTCVSALDTDKSIYECYPDDYFLPKRRGMVRSLLQATLHAAALEGHHIVRLREYRPPFYVSERFRDTFVGNGFTGLSFERIRLS